MDETSQYISQLFPREVKICDETLRDGNQTPRVSFNLENKIRIAKKLDEFGFDYIVGGMPSSGSVDQRFFKEIRDYSLNARIVALGLTRKSDIEELVETEADVLAVVGKSSAEQVTKVLDMEPEQNLKLIEESIDFLKKHGYRVFFDAEHFYDGFRDDRRYAFDILKAAENADEIILCDTRGGSIPWEIFDITKKVRENIKKPIGIHCHNDMGVASVNTIFAIAAGAEHVQGTINGLGERCGNADFCEILPTLEYKLGVKTVGKEKLKGLKELSEYVGRISGIKVPSNSPYIGDFAFIHTAGSHGAAVSKYPPSYEIIDPELVGNQRSFSLSRQMGRATVVAEARKFGYELDKSDPVVSEIVSGIKEKGMLTDVQLLLKLKQDVDKQPMPFELVDYWCITGKNTPALATIKVRIDGTEYIEASEGVGVVHALDIALRKILTRHYEKLRDVKLASYNVNIMDEEKGTAATTRVYIGFNEDRKKWETVGISDNIIKASSDSLIDGYLYSLLRKNSQNNQYKKVGGNE